jgi:hypothetical protein
MREVASLASAYGQQQLPPSLMQRLELMQHFARVAQASGQPQGALQPRRMRRSAHAIVLAWFSLGVMTSGAIGAATIAGLRAHAAGGAPLATIASMASTAWAAWAKAPPAGPETAPAGEWDRVQLTIERAERARMLLPLQVSGTDGAAFEVVLEGLPAGVRPSRGEARGQAWVLGRDDLDGLFLALDETAPDAFDMRISVAMAPGGSMVQVRRVDAAPQRQASAPASADLQLPALAHLGISDGPETFHAPDVARAAVAGSGGRASAAHRRPVATAAATDAAPPEGRRTWPEGASGLGAVWREPEGPSWWQMPPPSWSPFVVGQERP